MILEIKPICGQCDDYQMSSRRSCLDKAARATDSAACDSWLSHIFLAASRVRRLFLFFVNDRLASLGSAGMFSRLHEFYRRSIRHRQHVPNQQLDNGTVRFHLSALCHCLWLQGTAPFSTQSDDAGHRMSRINAKWELYPGADALESTRESVSQMCRPPDEITGVKRGLHEPEPAPAEREAAPSKVPLPAPRSPWIEDRLSAPATERLVPPPPARAPAQPPGQTDPNHFHRGNRRDCSLHRPRVLMTNRAARQSRASGHRGRQTGRAVEMSPLRRSVEGEPSRNRNRTL
jgi:hypothetical protein